MKTHRQFKAAGAVILCGAIISLSLSGCASAQALAVKVASAEQKSIEASVEISGVLAPVESDNIASKISGKVASANFEAGDAVSAGQALVKLDTTELSAQLESARASYGSIADQVKQAKIPMDSAAVELSRMHALFAEGAVSQVALDQAQTAYDSAKARYDAANSSGLAQAGAAVDSVTAQIGNATLTSPIDGVVVAKNIHAGEIASPGVNLITVANISSLKLKGTIGQEYFPYLQTGQKVILMLDAFPGKEYEGEISLLGPVSVGTGSYFPIELLLSNPGELTAGLSAHSSISVKGQEGVAVPSSALVKDGSEEYVFVMKDGTAEKRIVKTGMAGAGEMMIIEGLSAGEKVAVTNAKILSDGMKVTVSEE